MPGVILPPACGPGPSTCVEPLVNEDRSLVFTGLWDRWTQGDEVIESCTILTTEANDVVRPVHDHMPVLLCPASYQAWLDSSSRDLLQPCSDEEMTAWPVSPFINLPLNDEPACIWPVRVPPSLF